MEDLKVRLIGYRHDLTHHPFLDEIAVTYIDYERLKVGLTGVLLEDKEKKFIKSVSFDFNIEVDMQDIVNWRQIFLNEVEKVYIVHNESIFDKVYNWYCRNIKDRTNTINEDLV